MPNIEGKPIVIRRAVVSDVPTMAQIINGYASRGLMLPKSQYDLYQGIRRFVVVTSGHQLIGCGALHVFWHDLAEVRSLAVEEEWLGQGIGRIMLQHLVADARSLGVPKVFTLTYRQRFFERLGFREVPKESLPHKIWVDCLNCPKYPDCDETAMILDDLEAFTQANAEEG